MGGLGGQNFSDPLCTSYTLHVENSVKVPITDPACVKSKPIVSGQKQLGKPAVMDGYLNCPKEDVFHQKEK